MASRPIIAGINSPRSQSSDDQRSDWDKYGTRAHDMREQNVTLRASQWRALVRRLRREVEDSGSYESKREAVELVEEIQEQLENG